MKINAVCMQVHYIHQDIPEPLWHQTEAASTTLKGNWVYVDPTSNLYKSYGFSDLF